MLSQQIERFWKIDSFDRIENLQQCLITPPEKYTLNKLEQGATIKKGHFQVPLLRKNENPSLRNDKEIALKRFYSLEKKLSKNPQIKSLYQKQIKNISKPIMRYNQLRSANETSSIANNVRPFCF